MATDQAKIRVWDAPVRVFHWLMVLSFAGAYLTAESERWRLVHVTLGYTLGGLVAFRLIWGCVGTRYARFANFVRGPAAVMRYLRSLLNASPEHHLGHNPAGAVAIVLLLLSSIVIVGTGWASYNSLGGNGMAELHEGASSFMLAVVLVHVVGVGVSSLLHRESLVRAMVTGYKLGKVDPDIAAQGIVRRWRVLAIVMVLVVLGFWWLQWRGAP